MITIQVIGKTVEEAKALCDAIGFQLRITREDSNWFIVTRDYRTDRVNVEIEHEKIVKASIG